MRTRNLKPRLHDGFSSPLVYLPLAALVLYLGLYLLVGEHVPHNGGLGFDGWFFGRLASDVPAVLWEKVPYYYLDRMLPSVVVWLSSKAVGAHLSDPQRIVIAFELYNSVLLIAASLAWVRITRILKLSVEVSLIGAGCLFLNWLVTKQYLYFSVQTDTTALFLGVILALCVLERRLFALTVVAFIASFAWKTVMPFSLLLVVFSRPALQGREMKWLKWQSLLPLIVAVLACASALYIILRYQFQLGAGAAPVDMGTFPLSVLLLGGYAYYVARSTPTGSIIAGLRIGRLLPIAVFLAAWGLRYVILSLISMYFGQDKPILGFKVFAAATVATAIAKPAIFLIAHVVAFGPGILLLLWLLPGVMRAAASHSVGAVLFLGVNLVLALNSESRILAYAYPLMIVFLCTELNRIGVSRRFAVTFLVVSLLLARFYLPLNKLGIVGNVDYEGNPGILTRYPWQWFFMNIGPYMSWVGYAANAAMTLLAGLALMISWRTFRPASRQPRAEAPA